MNHAHLAWQRLRAIANSSLQYPLPFRTSAGPRGVQPLHMRQSDDAMPLVKTSHVCNSLTNHYHRAVDQNLRLVRLPASVVHYHFLCPIYRDRGLFRSPVTGLAKGVLEDLKDPS